MNRKVINYFLGFLFVYFIVGGVVFNHLFPPQYPELGAYFSEKKQFESQSEGLIQEVKKVDFEKIYLKIKLKPMAVGPPVHVHEHSEEYFFVQKGTLSLLLNGEKKLLKAGESITIPPGTPHKPFNETTEEVILDDSTNTLATMPSQLAYCLSETYPFMDRVGAESPKMLLKLASLGNRFDTWLADAPIPAQKVIRWLLGPSARLFNI